MHISLVRADVFSSEDVDAEDDARGRSQQGGTVCQRLI